MRLAPLILLVASTAGAQIPPATSDLGVGGAFLLGALVLSPLDKRMHDFLTQPSLEQNVTLHRSASTISALILPGTAGLLLATYVGGQLGHDRGLAEIGFHGGEAIFLGEVATGVFKIAFGRSRPSKSPDDPYVFHLGAGLGHDDQGSLPSAHATAAFALAAVLSTESARWWHHVGWVGPVAYTGAASAGVARIYLGKHWMSDVLTGAGIGICAGLLVTHFSESHPNNGLDRAFLP